MQSFLIPGNETADRRRSRLAAHQMTMAPPTDLSSGIQSVAQALMMREMDRQGSFPAAPGGAQPSFMTGLKNMFRLGGGLK